MERLPSRQRDAKMLIIDSTSSRCQLNIGPGRMQRRVLAGAIVFVVEVVGRYETSRFGVVGGAAQQAMSIDGGLNWKSLRDGGATSNHGKVDTRKTTSRSFGRPFRLNHVVFEHSAMRR